MRVDIGGLALEVQDHGEGTPVVLLHGFPLSSEIWDPIRPAVEHNARLITPDLRGFGSSDKPEGDYSMEAFADDVVRLADALGLERFVLGGQSMGGYVALRVAARARDRLLGLVLVDSKTEADTPEGAQRRGAAIQRIRAEGPGLFLDEFVQNLVGPSTRARAPRFLTELRALAAQVPPHVLIGCLEAMRDRPDSTDVLANLGLPTLVLVGEEDTITPPATARAMADSVPGATLAIIRECGHTPPVERPIPTADAIARFVLEIRATG